MANTKEYWKSIVLADEIDAHLVQAGQAEVNANLIEYAIDRYVNPNGKKIYVPGAGTGQMFDFFEIEKFKKFEFLFSDINPDFLEKIEERLSSGLNFQLLVDDIEESSIQQKVDMVVASLILQHINWEKGLTNILKTNPSTVICIIQQQELTDTKINEKKKLLPSMEKFSKLAKTVLVDKDELVSFMQSKKYSLLETVYREVPDDTKIMCLLIFKRV